MKEYINIPQLQIRLRLVHPSLINRQKTLEDLLTELHDQHRLLRRAGGDGHRGEEAPDGLICDIERERCLELVFHAEGELSGHTSGGEEGGELWGEGFEEAVVLDLPEFVLGDVLETGERKIYHSSKSSTVATSS